VIVAVVGLKGGVGKTSVSIHLAGEACARGHNVVLADADPWRSVLTWAVEAGAVRAAPSREPCARSGRDLTRSGRRGKGDQETPYVVAVTAALGRQIRPLMVSHTWAFIDCPPGGEMVPRSNSIDAPITRAALEIADLAVVPTLPAPTDFWRLTLTARLIREVQARRPGLRAAILLNQMNPRETLSAQARAGLADFGLPVLTATLGQRSAFRLSIAEGTTISRFRPRSEAAAEIRRLFDELEANQ